MPDPSSDDREALVMHTLRIVRAFGDAHDRMSSGMKLGMDMNTTDIAALRLLIMRTDKSTLVTPADLARHLRISTASTTKLIDRLVASGHVVRSQHTIDRRARVVSLTDHARHEFFRHFGQRLSAMRASLASFADHELYAAIGVLNALSGTLDESAS